MEINVPWIFFTKAVFESSKWVCGSFVRTYFIYVNMFIVWPITYSALDTSHTKETSQFSWAKVRQIRINTFVSCC